MNKNPHGDCQMISWTLVARLMCALQNMRMSCNSTYLLDQETDHGVKADELAALFDQLFAEPEAKAVVFSQWTRTHDIVIRRLWPLPTTLAFRRIHGLSGIRRAARKTSRCHCRRRKSRGNLQMRCRRLRTACRASLRRSTD